MHCLEVIIKRNSEAAGREQGHAMADGDVKRALAIGKATLAIIRTNAPRSSGAYLDGLDKGKKE